MKQMKQHNLFCQISDDVYVCMVPRCANSTIAALSARYLGFKLYEDDESCDDFIYNHFNNSTHGNKWQIIDKYIKKYDDILDKENKKFVCIYRDPLDRVISAYNVFKRYTFPMYLNILIKEFNTFCLDDVEEHVRPQYTFYDSNIINTFVNIKDLESYLQSINVKNIVQNKTADKSYYIENVFNQFKDKLLNIYKKDYELLNNIPKEKLFHI